MNGHFSKDHAERLAFVEVASDGVPDIGPEVLPSICLDDDGMTKGAGDAAAFRFFLVNFKGDLVYGLTSKGIGMLGAAPLLAARGGQVPELAPVPLGGPRQHR